MVTFVCKILLSSINPIIVLCDITSKTWQKCTRTEAGRNLEKFWQRCLQHRPEIYFASQITVYCNNVDRSRAILTIAADVYVYSLGILWRNSLQKRMHCPHNVNFDATCMFLVHRWRPLSPADKVRIRRPTWRALGKLWSHIRKRDLPLNSDTFLHILPTTYFNDYPPPHCDALPRYRAKPWPMESVTPNRYTTTSILNFSIVPRVL